MIKIYLDAERAYLEEQIIKKDMKNLEAFRVMKLPLNKEDILTIGELRNTIRKAYDPIIEQGIAGMYFVNKDDIEFNKILLANRLSSALNNCYELNIKFDVLSIKDDYSKSIVQIKKIELGIYNFIF